jgi:hypothetical protein
MGQEFGVRRRRKITLGTLRRECKNNIKIDLQGTGMYGAWTRLVWLRKGTSG